MLGYLYGKRFGSKIAIFEPKLFPYKYPNAHEDGTDRVLRNVDI
jgi:hypothetical protein